MTISVDAPGNDDTDRPASADMSGQTVWTLRLWRKEAYGLTRIETDSHRLIASIIIRVNPSHPLESVSYSL